MKIMLASLNSKYIHLNLANRYLINTISSRDNLKVYLKDYTINQLPDQIIKDIFRTDLDVVAFSVYIWNITQTLQVVRKLKKIDPGLTVILGGPEVSYNPKETMEREETIDFIISGEGEDAFPLLINALFNKKTAFPIPNVTYRMGSELIVNPIGELVDFKELPLPYTGDLPKNRLIYYESSRGCPYNCAYCMSSTLKGVRYRNIEDVRNELDYFISQGVKTLKFVDRTFNIDKERSFKIIKYIIDHDRGLTTFHMELAPNLIDQDWIDLLEPVRKGLFQFEIGIQSINTRVLKASNRTAYFENYRVALKKLLALKQIHSHVDLIAGLPYETYESFMNAFNAVYALDADHFQMGFLKLLNGSPLRNNHRQYGYVFDEMPPYEVISNDVISYEEILVLKEIEDLLEKYTNAHHFDKTMLYILKFYDQPSCFFEAFAAYWRNNGHFEKQHKLIDLSRILYEFLEAETFSSLQLVKELLLFDYRSKRRTGANDFFSSTHAVSNKQRIHDFLKNENNVQLYLPQFEHMKIKEIIKHTAFVRFNYNVLDPSDYQKEIFICFDYLHDKFGMIELGDEI
jgi:radical SAM superfamily enzyme YgiQ (UPF0313 family)